MERQLSKFNIFNIFWTFQLRLQQLASINLVLAAHGHQDEDVAHQAQDEGDGVHHQGQRHLGERVHGLEQHHLAPV